MSKHVAEMLFVLLITHAFWAVPTLAATQPAPRAAVVDGLPQTIPLTLLLGNAKYRNPQLDNDGAYVAYIRPDANNVNNVFVQQLPRTPAQMASFNTSIPLVEQRPAAERQVTFDAKRGVSAYSWAEDDSTIFYLQDTGGDENFHLWMVPVSSLFKSGGNGNSSKGVDLTPYPGVKVQGIITSDQVPRKIYFSMNKRDPTVYDLYSLDLDTREVLLHAVNPGDVSSWLIDYDFNLRGADNYNSTDGSAYIQVSDDVVSSSSSSTGTGSSSKTTTNQAITEEKGRSTSSSTSSSSSGSRKVTPVPELFKQAAAGNWTLQQWIAASVTRSDVSKWRVLLTFPFGEDSNVYRFNKAGDAIYGTNSVGRDTTELVLWSTAPGAKILKKFASSELSNVGGVIFNPQTWTPEAVSFNYLRPRWEFFSDTLKAMFAKLQGFQPARDPNVVSRSLDSKRWIVSYNADNTTTAMYLYTVGSWPPQLLLELQPDLAKYTLAHMHSVVIPARDGLKLPAYLTLPVKPGVPSALPSCVVGPVPDLKADKKKAMDASPLTCPLNLNLPLILHVHGGPWSRDTWGTDSVNQFLANRGYAVLQVNFRGSTGYGKNFLNAGNLQWGVGSMQHDLTDAVKWAWEKGIADRNKTCIFGASYGGYATLAGLAFTPDLYACGVDLVGVSNLKTFLASMPPYWKPLRVDFVNRVGDSEANATLNHQLSPVFHVHNIRAPLLMGQGSNDPRVPKAESDQMFEAMKKKGLDMEYLLYPDEGHGLVRPDNRLDFYSRMEQFLSKHLGGRAEPLLKPAGSSVQVVTHV